jgi:hypothetical protein
LTGQHVLIDALARWSGWVPGTVVGLLAVVLLIMGWILTRGRR